MENKITINIYREKGSTYFEFEIDEAIEAISRERAEMTKKSSAWPGLEFYSTQSVLEDREYQNSLREHGLYDDYGSGLIRNDGGELFNIAFIRTVGGKGKIKVPESVTFARATIGCKAMISFLRKFYQEYMNEYNVKGYISTEV